MNYTQKHPVKNVIKFIFSSNNISNPAPVRLQGKKQWLTKIGCYHTHNKLLTLQHMTTNVKNIRFVGKKMLYECTCLMEENTNIEYKTHG